MQQIGTNLNKTRLEVSYSFLNVVITIAQLGKLARNCGQLSIRYANKTSCFSTFPVIGIIFSEIIYGMEECFLPYPNNSPGGQFPTVQVLVMMSGFIPW